MSEQDRLAAQEQSTMDSSEPIRSDNRKFILNAEEDLAYEQDILRNPHSVKHWLRYVDYKHSMAVQSNASVAASTSSIIAASIPAHSQYHAVYMIFERALKELPYSFKLWKTYLTLRVDHIKEAANSSQNSFHDQRTKDSKKMTLRPTDLRLSEVANTFERALCFMHKMPRIWINYLTYMTTWLPFRITDARRAFDRALQALPITQHSRIWTLYLNWASQYLPTDAAIRVFERYLKLQPDESEDYYDYLSSAEHLDSAAKQLVRMINRDSFVSRRGKSKHELWLELCELICRHPDKIKSLDVDGIIRAGLSHYVDQQGMLWCALAEYYTRSGLFERSRDIYEEAIQTVVTVRDFSQIFEAYSQSEERLLATLMESSGDQVDEVEIDLRMARYEDLIERRPLLLNSVALRQNPHNVDEWLKRVELLVEKDLPTDVVATFTDAVETIDPKLALGRVSALWVAFAKYYEENDQLDDARLIFDRAVLAEYYRVDDLASVWCEYAEMELRHGEQKRALKIMERATTPPPLPKGKGKKESIVSYFDEKLPVQFRVHKALRLWSFYADLEESFGSFATTKAVYERMLELKIATPQIIINFALFLEENKYFEEAFKAYEKGIALFRWPNVYDLWNSYLTKFLVRYGGSKLERARDLFEQCIDSCPAKFAKNFYLLYAKLEEDFGLGRHAMSIYDRATRAVLAEERAAVYNIYIKRASQLFGITSTREIFEQAIENLGDEEAREMCLKFADVERKLGEIDRARAIYAHCSQMCDPRVAPHFWSTWKEFEVKHGNEDTLREMLRIKRSVQAVFNTQVNFMTASMVRALKEGTGDDGQVQNSMRALDAEQSSTSQGAGDGEGEEENQLSAANRQPASSTSRGISFVKKDTINKPSSDMPVAGEHGADEGGNDESSDDEADEDESGTGAADTKSKSADVRGAASKGFGRVEVMSVPLQVFGTLKQTADEDEDEANEEATGSNEQQVA